jgi:hypothetical protein
VIPKTVENKLARFWASGIEVEIASRFNGEACHESRSFQVSSDDADYVTPAIQAIFKALRKDFALFGTKEIDEVAVECLRRSSEIYVGRADKSLGQNGEIEVALELHGCDIGNVGIVATLRSTNKVTMEGFWQDGSILLSYEPRVAVFD